MQNNKINVYKVWLHIDGNSHDFKAMLDRNRTKTDTSSKEQHSYLSGAHILFTYSFNLEVMMTGSWAVV